jgi:hypothetical protein
MKVFGRCFAAALTVVFWAGLLAPTVEAIPAFARRHKVSCTTCHAPFPKLKPYGDEFAGDGFMMPEEEKDRDYVIAGDDLLRLNRDFPIAVRFDAYGVVEEDEPVENDLQVPWGLKLLSGGTLYRSIGYYFYFYFSERGEVAGIEDAYIHFNDVFGVPLDVMVGQFQTSDPLMKRELRLTYEDYQAYKVHVGDSGTNLAYDRGLMFVYGIEASGTDLVAMVVNGNGKPEAGEDRKFDDDKYKNFGFRINQAIGEYASVGFYYYLGREKYPSGLRNDITYWGPDANVGVGPLELTAQYLLRTDSDPVDFDHWGLPTPTDTDDIETAGIVAELVFAPQQDLSRWYFTLLYNQVDSDLRPSDYPGAGVSDPDYETFTAGATYLLARNLRLLAEYTRELEDEDNRFVVGVVSGF